MATYILLVNWTEQGLKTIAESPGRLDAAKKLLAEMGGRFDQFYMTMGDCDMVCVCEAPDDDTMARFALRLAGNGAVRSRTMKAFPEKTYREILGSLK